MQKNSKSTQHLLTNIYKYSNSTTIDFLVLKERVYLMCTTVSKQVSMGRKEWPGKDREKMRFKN